jgi:hypothetical protein
MLALKKVKTEGRRDSTGGRGLMRGRGGLEEGERADMWARSVSDRKRGEERGAGPRVWWAARAGAGPKARKLREREKGGLLDCGLRRDRWAGGMNREREVWEGVFFLFIFQTLFQTFKSFKLFQNFSSFKLFSKKNFKSV